MCSRNSSSVRGRALSPEHLDEKDHDRLLGSRLELELNRSIEKMREEEAVSPVSHHLRPENSLGSICQESTINSSQPEDESPTSLINCTMELLEDIEMPNLSISQCEISDLISISSSSPNSPVKFPGHCRIEFPNRSSFVADEINKSAQLREPDTKEMDVHEKVAFLSAPLTACVKTLVSVDEIDTVSDKEVNRESHTTDVVATETRCFESEKEDTDANVTSSPIINLGLHLTLGTGFELLDFDYMNDSLLTSSVLAIRGNNDGTFTHFQSSTLRKKADPVEERRELSESEASYSSGFLSEACGVVAELESMACSLSSSSLTSSDHQMTIHPLDMNAVSDSLINSSFLTNSPDKETHLEDVFISPAPHPVAEKKFPGSKCENTPSNGNAKINYTFDGSSKPVNETDNDTDVCAVKMIELQESKKKFEGTVISNCGKVKQCLNSFDQKSSQNMNTTYDQKNNHPALNSTFDKHLENSSSVDGKIANTTFVQTDHCINKTFDGKDTEMANPSSRAINTTFETKEHQTANNTFVSKPPTSEAEERDKLNVTFERGEYKIASLNETVSLMDAEGEVLQLILDSTPRKPSKTLPDAASTPKCGAKPPQQASKRMLTKDPTQSFLHRISLGMRRDSQSQSQQEDKSSSSQDTNARPVISGLRIGCVDHQAVASQLRRLHSGASSVRSGPMRALPLQSISGAHERPHDSVGSPDSLDGIKGLPHNTHGDFNMRSSIQHDERSSLPSLDSVSSIENERPGTPDIGIITGIGLSTPDVFRSENPAAGPRITSTPAMRGSAFSCVVRIEGQAPTPITAPPSRSRVVSISSTASLPEDRGNDSLVWQGFSQESVKDSRRTANIPDSSASGISKQTSQNCKRVPDNLDSGISVRTDEKPQVKGQSIGTGGPCAEAVNVQRSYENNEKIHNQERLTINTKILNEEVINQETAEVSSGIIQKIEITQALCNDTDSCLKSLTGEEEQNVAATIRGKHHLKFDINIDPHNLSNDVNGQPKSIAVDYQEASVYGAAIEKKAQFPTHRESKMDTRVDFTTKEATCSVEIPLVSDVDGEYQTKVVAEGQQYNSTVASEQKLEFASDERKQIQTSIDERQQVETNLENQLVENSYLEKEEVKASDGKVHQMETSVGENQQGKVTASEELESCTAENQQVGSMVRENELVMAAVGQEQKTDGKQVETSVSEKLQVKTPVVCLQDCSDIKLQSKKINKSHLVPDVKTNQTRGTRKVQNTLKICKESSKEINVLNEKHKDKPDHQSSRMRSHSLGGMKQTQSVSGAQGGPDKNIGDPSVAVKTNSRKAVTSKRMNTTLKKSIANDGRPSQSSLRSLDKEDKENKRKSTSISSRQSIAQAKSGVSVLHGKKSPFTQPVLGSSNYGARRSLVTQPLASKNTFSAGKVPLKTNISHKPSKANSVDLKLTGQLKKAKGFLPESQSVSPKFLSALEQCTNSNLLEGRQLSSGISGKAVSKGEKSARLKLPLQHKSKLTNEQQTSNNNLQGDPTTESHVKSKLSRRIAGTAPVTTQKRSLLKTPKAVV